MNEFKEILEQYKNNEISLENALLKLKKEPFEDIGYAKIDLHRKVRQGAAEVIYGEGKTPEQIIGICDSMLKNGEKTILITRLSEASANIKSLFSKYGITKSLVHAIQGSIMGDFI